MRSRFPSRRFAVAAALVLAAATHAEAAVLRVCADPNNLPFSNRNEEGFENKLARLVADDLGASLTYTWWAQRRGFFRNTLKAGLCDAVMGVPSDFEMAAPTRPYYRSTYVFVFRADRGNLVRSLDDPALRTLRVGVQLAGDDYANTPPAHALANRGIVSNVVGFTLYGDYSRPNPPAEIVHAVARGDIDVAVVWGPLAGYFAARSKVPLKVVPIDRASDGPSLPFVFDISVGVRRGDEALRTAIDGVLERRRADVDKLLERFGVPRASFPSPSRGAS